LAMALRQAIWSAPPNTVITLHVPSPPHALRLRAGTSDAAVFLQVFGEHQAHFPVPHNPSVVVDAGANIGLTVAVFASRFPSAKVLALEVEQDNFALLQENTRGYANVRPIRKALWSRKARIQITNLEAQSWAYQVSEANVADPSSVEAL